MVDVYRVKNFFLVKEVSFLVLRCHLLKMQEKKNKLEKMKSAINQDVTVYQLSLLRILR